MDGRGSSSWTCWWRRPRSGSSRASPPADALTAPLLVLIVFASSITGPLSRTGLRSLFPVIVPKHLWERANAIDANGYVVATLVGPPAAAALVQFLGGPTALALIGLVFALAAFILRRAPDPPMETVTSGSLVRDAWDGAHLRWSAIGRC